MDEHDLLLGDEERAPDGHLAKLIAVAVAVAILLSLILPDDGKGAAVTAAIVVEVTERACIAQAGPGERMPKTVCALGTRDVPAHILSYPIAKRKK